MIKNFCSICNLQICQYCKKYGSKGSIIFLEKQFLNKSKPKQPDYFDINKAQLSVFHHLNNRNKELMKESSDKEISHNIIQKKE